MCKSGTAHQVKVLWCNGLAVLLLTLAGLVWSKDADAAMTKHQSESFSGTSLTASLAAGGRLYDNWIRETGTRSPREHHPLFPVAARQAVSAANSWRCVTCHGWDYRGTTGTWGLGENRWQMAGLTQMRGRPPAEIIKVLVSHGYDVHLSDQELYDLALFVSRGQISVDNFINPVTRRVRNPVPEQSVYYATICANCHGSQGRSMADIPPLGDFARSDPWQSLHKMLNGHPGDDMPALRAFGIQVNLQVLAYVQSLPTDDALASVARGGRLYDNWAIAAKRDFPEAPHPALPEGAKVPPGSNSWRCIQCHGWDYKGAGGVMGIRSLAGAQPLKVYRILTDETHRMDGFLNQKSLTDLSNFVSYGQVEMDAYIDPTSNRSRGNPAASIDFFETLCATCHGLDGRAIRTMPPLGREAVDDPYKSLHKILHGHPGEDMPAWQAVMASSLISDILAKLQTLPTNK